MNSLYSAFNLRLIATKRLITILLVIVVFTFLMAFFAAPSGLIQAGPATSDTYCSGC